MEKITVLNIGPVFKRVRCFKWSFDLIRRLCRIDIDFKLIRYHELLESDFRFPEISSMPPLVKLYSFTPDRRIVDYIERKYGQTHKTPGKEYARAFSEIISVSQEKLEKQIGDVVYLNSPLAIKQVRDKRRISEVLMKHNLPHPHVMEDPTAEKVMKRLDEGETLCLKPVAGAQGRGVTKVFRDGKGYSVQTTWRASNQFDPADESHVEVLTEESFREFLKKYLDFGCLVQEWLEPLRGTWKGKQYIFDIREIVVYPKIYGYPVTEIARRASPNEVTTNISMNMMPAGYNFLKESLGYEGLEVSRELALKASKHFRGLNVCGVDILWTKKGEVSEPFVLELNAFPGQMVVSYSGVNFPLLEVIGAIRSLGWDIGIDPSDLIFKRTVEELY